MTYFFSRVILSLSHTELVVADTLCDDLHLYSASFLFTLVPFLFMYMYVCMDNAAAGVSGWQIFEDVESF